MHKEHGPDGLNAERVSPILALIFNASLARVDWWTRWIMDGSGDEWMDG